MMALILALFTGVLSTRAAMAAEPVPRQLQQVTVEEHLGQAVDPDLHFVDSTGERVRLGDVVRGEVPTILTLNYYACENLCGVQLNALEAGIRELGWRPGDRYRVVTISIDPTEGPELAAAKRAGYLEKLGMGDVDWRFMVGDAADIGALADSVGFGFQYDEETRQYAHPAVLVFLSPEGSVARYVYGLTYAPKDLKFATMEAAAGRVGSPVDKLILSCFQYDQTVGRYAPAAFGMMRLGGGLTMLALGALGLVMWRRERARGVA